MAACEGGRDKMWLPHNQEALAAPLSRVNPEMAQAMHEMTSMLADNARAMEDHDHGDGMRSMARMRGSGQTTTTAVNAIVTWQTQDYECGCADGDTSTGKITLSHTGIWHLAGSINFTHHATGTRRLDLVVNDLTGTYTIDVDERDPLASGNQTRLKVASDFYAPTGTTVWLVAHQTSGGSLNLSSTYQNHLEVFRIGTCVGTTYCVGSGC